MTCSQPNPPLSEQMTKPNCIEDPKENPKKVPGSGKSAAPGGLMLHVEWSTDKSDVLGARSMFGALPSP